MKENRPKLKVNKVLELALKKLEPTNTPMMIWGQTGMGKTDLCLSLAKETGRELRAFYPAGLEPSDLSRLPIGGTIGELVKFVKTDLIHFEKGKKYILFLDELNRAPRDVRQALLPLWNSKPFIGVHDLSDSDIWIVTAMNDSTLQDNVEVDEVDDALLTRSAQVIIENTTKDVGEYIRKKYGNHNLIGNYLSSNYIGEVVDLDFANVFNEPSMIMPTPRNFEKAAKLVNDVQELDEYDVLALHSVLGTEVVTSFQAFVREIEKLNPEIIFTEKEFNAKLKKYMADINPSNVAILLNGFQQAIEMIKTDDSLDVRQFVNNVMKLAKDDKGKNAYRDIIGSIYAKIRQESVTTLQEIMVEEPYISFFLEFYDMD